MIYRIDFALIDAKDYPVAFTWGFPKTEKNVRLTYEMRKEYLQKLKKLQTEIEIKYFSQFEQVGDEISEEKSDEIYEEFWEKRDESLYNLYYT